jgi:hypothetical protein
VTKQASGTTGIPACQPCFPWREDFSPPFFITPTKVGVHSGSAFSRQVKYYSEAPLQSIHPERREGYLFSSLSQVGLSPSGSQSSSSSIIQIELKDNLQHQSERFTQTWAEMAGATLTPQIDQ